MVKGALCSSRKHPNPRPPPPQVLRNPLKAKVKSQSLIEIPVGWEGGWEEKTPSMGGVQVWVSLEQY